MNNDSVIVVTGAAGFIGSCMVQYFNEQKFTNLILVDNFDDESKLINWQSKQYLQTVNRDEFTDWLNLQQPGKIVCIVHLGARTDTAEFDYSIHEHLNVAYTKMLWNYCAMHQLPFIYASSAATYGNGELGYDDDHQIVEKLEPLNPYGVSKNNFDKWALQQETCPANWAGLKFFNVYGPNEYHKARMASMVWHSFNQISATGHVKLFKSYHPNYKDGEQLRDFIYVKDLLKVIFWMTSQMLSKQWDAKNNGLYNLGTGEARSFVDLVNATFKSMRAESNITFVDMPDDIRDKYQYFTKANMQKLRSSGYTEPFFSLEEGAADYVANYLLTGKYY